MPKTPVPGDDRRAAAQLGRADGDVGWCAPQNLAEGVGVTQPVGLLQRDEVNQGLADSQDVCVSPGAIRKAV